MRNRIVGTLFTAAALGLLSACTTDRDDRMDRRSTSRIMNDEGVVFKTPASTERQARQELEEAKAAVDVANEAAGAERPKR